MKILFKNAKIIVPESNSHQKKRDVLVENGKISAIQASIQTEVDREISIKNLHLSEGWFDSSVSFGEPGFEERETLSNGLETAAKSGFTAIALNPSTFPVIDTGSNIAYLKGKASKKPVNLYPIGALSKNGKGLELAEIYDMSQAGAVAFGDYKKAIGNPNLLKIALQYAQGFKGLVLSYPQENKIVGEGQVNESVNSISLGLKGIPSLAEELQIARDLYLLEYTGGKLHIPTISTQKSVRLVKEAKKKGLDVTCSVAVHNLFFTDDKLAEYGSNYKVLPPLRTKKDVRALIKGLKEGTIDMVTSDHFPVNIEHKNVEFEHALYGTIGLETSFGALGSLFDTETCVRLLTAGKKRFSIENNEFSEGKKANFTLFVPGGNREFQESDILSTSKNSIFTGETLKGKTIGTFSNNQLTLAQK